MLAAAATISDDEIATLSLDGLDQQMRTAIMSTATLGSTEPAARRLASRHRWRLRRHGLAAAAVVAVVSVAVVLSPFGRSADSAWAAEVLAVAEASPRLLVDLPGWEVTWVGEFTTVDGGMTFSNGESELEVNWRPVDTHDRFVLDRAAGASPPRQVTVNGQPGTEFQTPGTPEFITLWRNGDQSFEARGLFADRDSYAAVVEALTPTDIDSWLNAMPDSVVRPGNRSSVIASMLNDIPQPDGFDVSVLEAGADLGDRYQLGALVVGSVACKWLEQWVDARSAGDTAAEAEAVAAMGTARNWAILLEMDEEGHYPEVLWEYADAIASDGTVVGGMVLTVEESYYQTFNCGAKN